MKRIFVDTSAWGAIVDSGDSNYKSALRFKDEIAAKYQWVVTNYIWNELYTLLLRNVGYHRTLAFKRQLDLLTQKRVIEVVWISATLAAEAWDVFERFNVGQTMVFYGLYIVCGDEAARYSGGFRV